MEPDHPDPAQEQIRLLFEREYGYLVGWARRVVGSTEVAHRLVTAAFVRLLRTSPPTTDPRAWLHASITHQLRGRWRYLPGQRGEAGRSEEPQDEETVPGWALRRAVLGLPVTLREVAILHHYGGLDAHQVAGATGSPVQAVERNLARVTTLLREDRRAGRPTDLAALGRREREAVTPESAEESRWERIVHLAGRGRRSWFGPAAALVAVLAVLVIAWSWWSPLGLTQVRPAGPVTQLRARQTPAEQRRPTVQLPGPVEPGFVPWSLSSPGGGSLLVLGGTRCGAQVCPMLVRSADDGAGWARVHQFHPVDLVAPQVREDPGTSAGSVTRTRFADSRYGLVTGPDLWATRDGGARFDPLGHPGQVVLDALVRDDDVLLLTADGCAPAGCTGPLQVSRVAGDGRSPARILLTQPIGTTVVGGDLLVSGSEVLVRPVEADGLDPAGPWRVEGARAVPLAAPAGCGRAPLAALVTVTAPGRPALLGMCRPGRAGRALLVRSTDAGRSWGAAASGAVDLPTGGRLSLAAVDGRHVAVAAGSSGTRVVRVSGDGGRSWAPPAGLGSLATGVEEVVAAGGDLYLLTSSAAVLWRSRDGGRTWQQVSLVAPAGRSARPGGSPSS